MKLYIDCETYSELELKTVGTYRYAANCEVMLVTWAVDNTRVEFIDLTQPGHEPQLDRLRTIIRLGRPEIIAHNAMFDRTVFNATELLETVIRDWRCTMVQALSHGLPGGLDDLCEIYKLGSDKAKIKDGRRLIQLFCKPRPKNSKLRRATKETHPEDWQRFIQYAMNDIEAMRELEKKMPRWNYPSEPELSLWHLDQVINDRGFLIDRGMGEAVIRAVDRAKKNLAKEVEKSTGGEVESTAQRDAILEYVLREHGVVLEDLTKSTVSRLLEDEDIPEPVKEILRIRQQESATSTAKYKALLNRADDDDRFRGGLQFSGAARTRRASGRGFQPQNLPSRGLLPNWLIEEGVKLMRMDAEQLVFPNVMYLASSAVRSIIVAPQGQHLCVADLSNIEGRKVAWYANEEWKLKAFRDFDAGIGHDLYNLAYSKAFRVSVESVTKPQRAIGKVMELMLGYAGGAGAFVTGALGYGFDLEKLADDIADTLPQDTVNEAADFLEWVKDQKRPRHGLTDKAFIVVETLKRLWRKAHPATIKLWSDLQYAAESVIQFGEPREVGKLIFDKKGSWLRIKLPSGRYLCYPFAKYQDGSISYYGIDQYTRKWQEIRTYSGKLLENICQSSARDVLYDAMPRIEGNGYQIVLTVHDEIVAEADKNKTAEELAELMASGEPWTDGLPLAAAGFECERYRKGD